MYSYFLIFYFLFIFRLKIFLWVFLDNSVNDSHWHFLFSNIFGFWMVFLLLIS